MRSPRALPASRVLRNADKLMFYLSIQSNTRWWFHRFLIFTPTWGNDSIWLIFFRWVETTNQNINFTGAISWVVFFKASSFNNLRFSSQFFNTHRFVDSASMSFSVSAKILETKQFLEDWAVVSNIFYLHPETWGRFSPMWRPHDMFQMGLFEVQPPTRKDVQLPGPCFRVLLGIPQLKDVSLLLTTGAGRRGSGIPSLQLSFWF